MTYRTSAIAALLVCAVSPILRASCHEKQQVTLEADLNQRLKPYLKIRNDAKGKVPALTNTEDPAQLESRQQALTHAIRTARAGARQGDILGGPITECLRPLIQHSLDRASAKKTMKEGNPATEGIKVNVKVNGPYPAAAPLSTMPPRLLSILPKLPKGLEYRFVGQTLILYDADAGLIIDYISNAGA
jgi:hypothetical protein